MDSLLERAHSGDQEACRLLYEQYKSAVIRVIRRRYLPPGSPLRRMMDSDDLAQMVWRLAFEQLNRGEDAFPTEKKFVNFLLTITQNAFRKEYRHYVTTAKRTISRDELLDAKDPDDFVSQADNPANDAAVTDDYWQFLDQLPSERRSFVRGAIEAGGIPELAHRLGLSEHATARIIGEMKVKWARKHHQGPKN
jgi:RNA polymerase sigma factor (sigma-70 family)